MRVGRIEGLKRTHYVCITLMYTERVKKFFFIPIYTFITTGPHCL